MDSTDTSREAIHSLLEIFLSMKVFRILIQFWLYALIVTSLEERLLLSDNVLQNEIQELKSKVMTLEQKVATLESKSAHQSIVFMSQLSKTLNNPANGHTVVFDDTITNVGHAYSNVTGVFRAPVDGNYMFSMIGTVPPSPGGHSLHLLLRRNGSTIGYLFLDSNHDYFLKRTEVVAVTLSRGDEIFVQVDAVSGTHSIIGCCYHTHFSGFLIN
ncbi:complement C1q-like protein 4 [Saccostrea echinata]|uniref:complement C1q-like protein 4 n=1 Tax=Saccostrea echinata TaxID=191078 RepID=UPI002A82FF73|nr:complement C1q-like protein 4 [Saccostrea echinata]